MEQLEEVLDPRLIRLNLQASSKRDAITQLSETLEAADYINDVPAFVKDIYLREERASPELATGLRFPMARVITSPRWVWRLAF